MDCKECAEVGLEHTMHIEPATVQGTRVKVGMFCDWCDYATVFDSYYCDEYGDGWKEVHGSHWDKILRLREQQRHKVFWDAVREWRRLRNEEPEEYIKRAVRVRLRKNISRAYTQWVDQELLRRASPITILDKYCKSPENNNNGTSD